VLIVYIGFLHARAARDAFLEPDTAAISPSTRFDGSKTVVVLIKKAVFYHF
jgi:hypothetical protein